ncbi:MAG: AraC family transcriptional regulator [Clostridia bacterium]|nr:AraC family transcriptional regulator [Clostridia bacterium]
MISIDMLLLKQLLDNMKTLIKTNLQFFNNDFDGTFACTGPGNPLCSFVKHYTADKCQQTDLEAMQHEFDKDSPCYSYLCHFGFCEITIKLTHDGIDYGYIIIGPFRIPENYDKDVKNISDFCVKHLIDYDTVLAEYQKIPRITEEKLNSIKVIVIALFDYALRENIIYYKHSEFETEIEKYIEEHLHEELTIEQICKQMFLSPKQLYNVFKKETGMSPKKFITKQRIEKALNLIKSTNDPLPVIAERVGIPDYTYFVKVFKSYTGHTPTYYRKNN